MAEGPRVPWYIDQGARHRPYTMRMLAYMALAGREGVLNPADFAVTALSTPGAQINIAPGAFGVLNTASGASYEAYVDKSSVQLVRDVPATDATVGGRTDLVILRVKNPYAVGTGTYPIPANPDDGPYWDIDVITGVAPNINSVHVHNAAWSAITLARIVRPVNTGIVQQAHITDLRQLVDLSGERLIIVASPPVTAPPIAQQLWTSTVQCGGSILPQAQTTYIDWPTECSFQVPVPSFAKGADMQVLITPQYDGSVWGDLRMTLDGVAVNILPAQFDFNYTGGPGPATGTVMVAGTIAIPSAQAGKICTFRMQGRMLDPPTHPGKLTAHRGCYVSAQLNFKKYPV